MSRPKPDRTMLDEHGTEVSAFRQVRLCAQRAGFNADADPVISQGPFENSRVCNSADERAGHGYIDHGFGDIEAGLVVSDQAAIAGEPAKLRSTTQRRGRTANPCSLRRTIATTKSRNAALSRTCRRS